MVNYAVLSVSMDLDPNKCQVFLSWLPGYMWIDGALVSTGAALPPTQHVDPITGEVKLYVRPFFEGGGSIGVFIRQKGLREAIVRGDL